MKNDKVNPKIYTMKFASIYALLIAKVERKGHSKSEVDEVIEWLTGYSQKELVKIDSQLTYEDFFKKAPHLNPLRKLIKGKICGVSVEDIKEPIMQEIRYLDKLIDELAHGKSMQQILRSNSPTL